MYPHERSLVEKLADKPFVIIGVNSDRDLEQIQQVVKDKNLTWRSFWNGPGGRDGPISNRWNIEGWPTLYVIDAEGVIRHKQMGGDEPPIDRVIAQLLSEMGHKTSLEDLAGH